MMKAQRLLQVFLMILVLFCTGCEPNYYNPDTEKSVTLPSLYLDRNTCMLEEGASLMLTVSTRSYQEVPEQMTWQSADESIIAVKEGLITALKQGEATIQVSADGFEPATCVVTVIPLKIAVVQGEIPWPAQAGKEYEIRISFENCANPMVKVISTCANTLVTGEYITREFEGGGQCKVSGDTIVQVLTSEYEGDSLRLICYDEEQVIDVVEYSIHLEDKVQADLSRMLSGYIDQRIEQKLSGYIDQRIEQKLTGYIDQRVEKKLTDYLEKQN